MDSLTARQRAVLELESQWFATAGGKDEAIRALGVSPIRYYQQLNALIETEAALAHSPATVNRLRRTARR